MEGLTGNPRMIVILKYFLITFAMLWMTGCAESPNNISKNYIDDPKYSSEECKEMRIKALEYVDQILGRMGTGLAFGVFLGPMGVPIAAASELPLNEERKSWSREVHLACSSDPLPNRLR